MDTAAEAEMSYMNKDVDLVWATVAQLDIFHSHLD